MRGSYSSAAFTTSSGVQVAALATITVRKEVDSTLATLFTVDGTTPLTNPFNADTDGRFTFTADGILLGYSVQAVSGSESTTVHNVALGNLRYQDDTAPVVGRVLAGNGTSSAPAYSFSGSTALGITRVPSVNGADAMLFYTASGVPAVSIARLADGSNTGLMLRGDGPLVWAPDGNLGAASITPSAVLWRDAAQTLAQRNGVNAQTFRLYSTFTDASNYERLAFLAAGASTVIGTEQAGTGVSRALTFQVGGTQVWQFSTGGHLFAVTDNARDIGASGANRPRNVFIGGNYRSDSASSQVVNLVLTGSSGNLQAGLNASKAVLFSSSGNLQLQVTSVGAASGSNIEFGGHIIALTDNTYDIGAAGATRPRNVYIGGNIVNSGTGTFNDFTGTVHYFRSSNTSDLLRITANAAGSGALVYASNSADSDYKSLSLIGDGINLKSRGGAGVALNVLSLTAPASAVNFFAVAAAVTAAYPTFTATGTDTDVGITFGSKGAGFFTFRTAGSTAEQLRIAHVASAVNFVQVSGGATGSGAVVAAAGSDSTVQLVLTSQGATSVSLNTNGGAQQQVVITHTASATRAVTLTGSNGGNPTIGTTAGSLAITPAVVMASDCQVTGTLDAPLTQNSRSAAYTTVRADAGKHILHPTADNNARTFTIDSNANVPYPIGTCITFVNEINTVTISITTDTLVLMGSGATGNRTLAANGIATALKTGTTKWVISGTGLT